MRFAPAASLVALLLVGTLHHEAAAQVRYVDRDGHVYFVDSLDQVPAPYRPGATGTPTKLVPPTPSGINWEQRWREAEARRERERADQERAGAIQDLDAARRQADQDQARGAQAAGQAALDGQRRADQAVKTATDLCISRVRYQTLSPKLDAFSPAPGYVELRGTRNERYLFDKCMAEEFGR